MPLGDKVEAAKKIDQLLKQILQHGGFRLKYRISVLPPGKDQYGLEHPAILVELSGPDSTLVLERQAEVLRAIETLAHEMLRLGHDEHERVSFDCMNFRGARMEELRLSAQVAAERVRKTGDPYEFSAMNSRERRMLHVALKEHEDLRTESTGEGLGRHVVVYPKDYKPKPAKPKMMPSLRRR